MTRYLMQYDPLTATFLVILSLIITVLAYGSFPLLFAALRQSEITKNKYRLICYGINFLVMFLFIAFSGGSNGAPYVLWTSVFASVGIKKLKKRGLLAESDAQMTGQAEGQTGLYLEDDPNRIIVCRSCGYRSKDYFEACPQCGKYAKKYEYENQQPPVPPQIQFCQVCGERLIEGYHFCRNCGSRVGETS